MTGTIQRHGQWFCSERCAAEFEPRKASSTPSQDLKASCHAAAPRWFLNPWVWVPASGLLIATLDWWWPAARPVSEVYVAYLKKVLWPFFLGLVLGGVIDHFVPKEYIVRLLSAPKKRVIALATALGFLASACSHGCLALTIELYRKGASIPAAVSFLLASPWASMSLTLLLLGLFGLKGFFLIGGALAIAMLTGLIFQRLAHRGWIDTNPNTVHVAEDFSLRADLLERWRRYRWTAEQLAADAQGIVRGMLPLGRMVLGWVQLGMVLSAVIGGLIPHGFFERYFGPSVGGLAATLGLAAVVEVCSEGTAPLAYELYRHTGALGNAFAFLMGGVVTDYTELAALWVNIGRRTVLWLLAVTLPLVGLIGWAFNHLGGG